MTDRTARLSRRTHAKVIAGVCGGIADRFGTSATLVRTLFVVSLLLPGPQVLIYLAMWILIPKRAPGEL